MNMSTTTTTATASISEKSQKFLDKLKGLKSSIQRTDLVTTKVFNIESGKNFTSKDKRVLGIPDDNNTIWSHPHFDKVTHSLICGVAKTIDRPVASMIAEIVMDWVEGHRAEIEEIGESYVRGEDDEATIQKKLDAAQRQMERLQAMLNSKK